MCVEKVTSEALPLGTDISLEAFEVADQIKAKSVQPKVAIASIKKRLNHKNPNVQIMTLTVGTLPCVATRKLKWLFVAARYLCKKLWAAFPR